MNLKKLVNLLLCIALAITMLIDGSTVVQAGQLEGTSVARAAGDVAINAANFPNANFRNFYVRAFDGNRDGKLSLSERNAVRTIDISGSASGGYRITDVKGIEFFPNLTKLDCSGTNGWITRLDVSKNTKLITLDCSDNQISTLDLSKNTQLEVLYCYYNNITKLDLKNNKKLKTVDAMSNQIKSLNVKSCVNLTSLNVRKNWLTTINVSKNRRLTSLDVAMNYLTRIEAAKGLTSLSTYNTDFSMNYLTKKELTSKLPTRLSTNGSWVREQMASQNKLAKPSGFKVTNASANSLKITWKRAKSVNGYEVQRATSKNGKYTKIYDGNKLAYTHKKLSHNKTYYYRVRAYKRVNGVKIYGAWTNVVSKKVILTKPNITVKARSRNSIAISWKKVSGAKQYEIHRATSKNGKYKRVKTVTGRSYTDTKLSKNRTYFYKIKAVQKIGSKTRKSAFSTAKSARTFRK